MAVGAGIAAGLQVGKVPPALPMLRASLNADLVTAGWIISVFNLVAATLGIAVGLAADRLNTRNLTAAGIFMMLLGAFAGGFCADSAQLIAARMVAGIGLVAIAVSAPRLIVLAATPGDRHLALGIWSIYTPAGMALGMLAAPPLLAAFGWRGLWRADAAVLMAFLAVFLYFTRTLAGSARAGPVTRRRDVGRVIRHPGPWLLGAVFALYAIQFFAVMSWLPTFLMDAQGYGAGAAALAAALVVGSNVAGNLSGAWMLHHGAPRWGLQLGALLIMACSGIGIFSELVGGGWKLPLGILFSASGGLLPAAVLAASAVHAPSPGQVATVNGVIVQCTNVGSLSGPPLMAAMVGAFGGWSRSWVLLVVCGLVGCLCVMTVRHIEKGMHTAEA